ncbi:MAG: 4-hydroxy-tetrahydrodipicolinate synthase [Chitinophagaceae bacterium]
MLRDQLKGTGVALITPFNDEHQVDYDSLLKLIDYDLKNGVEYLVILGTTGETPVLSMQEKTDIINFTVQYVNGLVPIVVGVGGNHTSAVIKELELLPLDKITAILSASPYYSKPSQEGLFQHYKAVSDASPKPLILYNVPSRTGRNLEASTVVRLASEVDNIAGIKEAGGDFQQCLAILKDKPSDFLVVSGDDALALPQLACGMDGVISVVANCFPKVFSEMVRCCLKGDFKNAKGYNDELLESYSFLFEENNPAGVKAVLSELGIIRNNLRLPLVPLSSGVHEKVKRFLAKLDA